MNFLELDAKTMADWEVDYVKMNSCIGRDHVKPDGFGKFSRLLNGTGRPMAFLCTYPLYETRYTKHISVDWKRLQNNCNLVRALPNIYSSWGSVFNIIDEYKLRNNILPKVAGPGHYNDPDMLVLGNNGLSNDQKRAHMGMWCMFAAPLLISADMDKVDEFSASLLRNKHLLAIDQDKGGHQAEFVKSRNDVQIAINNRFQALQDLLKEEETTMEDNSESIKEALISTCQEVLALEKHYHKESISIETLDRIKERKNKKTAINNSRTRAEKVQAQAEYIEANKQVKKSTRADKQKYMEELASMAEKAARVGNMKQLYDTTKRLAGKYSKPERPVKDKEGRPITEIQQQKNRWVRYFEEFLNRPTPMNPPDIEAAHTDLPPGVNPPTTEEIRPAI
ncbi:unnamed protein product [Schistosoma curassoni]|uniref:Alpha-galactosidase n=1 Tax=Schistosoma curassoni TaxID=6186 RepID=A0A183JP18_9TREM|nr:unnamed protein product [Schistosoma curassoni]